MTLTIEVAPEVTAALQAKATRLGVPLERYAAGVLRRDAEGNGDGRERAANGHPNSIVRALALLDELTPTIRAGTLTNGVKLDAAAELAALRDERFADA